MSKRSSKKTDVFPEIYSMDFEFGMRQILGAKAYHSANSLLCKRLMLEAIKTLERRIDEIITMDERLREMLFLDLGSLEKNIKNRNVASLVGNLFSIIGRLLGYDWIDGKTYRTPVYFRTKSEELAAYRMRRGFPLKERRDEENNLVLERHKIAKDLKAKGLTTNQIARGLNISEYAVNQILKDEVLAKVSELRKKGLDYWKIQRELEKLGYDPSSSLYRETDAARKRLLGENKRT